MSILRSNQSSKEHRHHETIQDKSKKNSESFIRQARRVNDVNMRHTRFAVYEIALDINDTPEELLHHCFR